MASTMLLRLLLFELCLQQGTQVSRTGSRIEIRGFGSFCLNYRPERLGRNPKSGESVVVPAKYVPHFKAGKEMRLRVDGSAQEA